ncbi:unnamed protein product [Phytophthora lilii]|uniref:Unnamed protein product n=1 Tax=Phytophthora lilii TaxID=2077276 RepID=A0A9W6TB85_9STRA|nr:unnamed protein product [Phytophthora lilii]
MTHQSVVACDVATGIALIRPIWNADVDCHWLRYGSLAEFEEWSGDVLHSARPTDLVLLLVRLSDLEAAHPELHLAKTSDTSVHEQEEDNPTNKFLRDLKRYDALTTAAPLVVLLCPCPPATEARFGAMECEMQSVIEKMKNVSVQSAKRLLELFRQQYTTAYYDAVADKRQHSPYTQAMLNVLSLSLCRQICRLFRAANTRKKVIVLDCDNTLWGGAVAEVGANGIDLSRRFRSLQRFVVAQQERGMLLALSSKNILDDVVEAFNLRRDDMVLDIEKHVVATKVNWKPKSENITELAKELSLGLDSFIFIDDNPLECNEVATTLPSVTVIALRDDFTDSFLEHEWVFDEGFTSQLCNSVATKEDAQRTQLYQQNLQREQLRESSSTHKAFLSALGVKIVFEELDHEQELRGRSSSFTRVLQLHHRTNQFNTSTTFAKRMEEETLLDYVVSTGHTVLCAHVTDRFGHYGLVSVALCQRIQNTSTLHVDSFLLSCRALNRGVEHAMMRRISEVADRTGATILEFAWEPTERNQPTHAFFSALSSVVFSVESYNQSDVAYRGQEHLSTSSFGTWILSTKKASQISFLKSEDSIPPSSGYSGGIFGWIRVRVANWFKYITLSAIQWILSSVILPQRVLHVISPAFVQQLGRVSSSGLIRVPLRTRGSLEQFLSPALRTIPNRIVVSSNDSADSNADDKFRRKARHQTKLVLVDHVEEEVSRVIWTANRPYSGNQSVNRGDLNQVTTPDLAAGSVVNLQLICKSPSCSAAVQRESRCAFKRCRNCCYRIQRLLTRSFHHANAMARQSAVNALHADFAVDAFLAAGKEKHSSSPDTQWCVAHENKRRRGEIFKQQAKDARLFTEEAK